MAIVSVSQFMIRLGLKCLTEDKKAMINLEEHTVNRSGLFLTGYYYYFNEKRIQLLGNAEWHLLNTFDKTLQNQRLEELCKRKPPAIILTRELKAFDKLVEYANKYKVPLFCSPLPSGTFMHKMTHYLYELLAENVQKHGVLVDVYGVGILIIGESGVGKSETALELIKRGHRLIADDVVIIKRMESKLIGSAPELIQNFLEVRGLGILDIAHLYGYGSVRNNMIIDYIIKLETWKKNKEYDRLGLDEKFEEILDISVGYSVLPIKPGRNIAMLIEVAARNYRQKEAGYNSAEKLNEKLLENLSK